MNSSVNNIYTGRLAVEDSPADLKLVADGVREEGRKVLMSYGFGEMVMESVNGDAWDAHFI